MACACHSAITAYQYEKIDVERHEKRYPAYRFDNISAKSGLPGHNRKMSPGKMPQNNEKHCYNSDQFYRQVPFFHLTDSRICVLHVSFSDEMPDDTVLPNNMNAKNLFLFNATVSNRQMPKTAADMIGVITKLKSQMS